MTEKKFKVPQYPKGDPKRVKVNDINPPPFVAVPQPQAEQQGEPEPEPEPEPES